MTRWMKRLVAVAAVTLLAALAGTPAQAATGNQGYAVYRNGVLPGGIEWHTAIMDKAHYNTPTYPVIHAPGSSGGNVKFATWSSFIDGNTYQGTYRPKGTAPTSAQRDLFVSRTRMLKDDAIPYNLIYQVMYSLTNSGSWVDPADITSMRCDGVVEYVFEWYDFRVYGSDTYWDVTKVGFWNQDVHRYPSVTPKKQASSYLTKVTSALP